MTLEIEANWVNKAKHVFKSEKPEHFTDYLHCEECADHDETLLQFEIDTLGLEELGNPGWDPICFCSPEAKLYLTPALIRLSLETISDHFYFGQFLFHLEYQGKQSAYYVFCSPLQRAFISRFIEFMILTYPFEIEYNSYVDEAFSVYQIWSDV